MGETSIRWPIAASLVGVLVVVVLLGGVLVARRMQASGDVAVQTVTAIPRTSTPLAAATPTSQGTAVPTSGVAAATAAPTRAALTTEPTSQPQTAATPLPAATADAAVSIVIDNGTPRVFAAGSEPTPAPTPTEWWNQYNAVSPELANELTGAFEHFWQVRAQALLDLNTAPLSEVMAGPLLQREVAGLDQMREQNQAAQIEVQHHMQIIHATNTDATIVDNYTSHTVPIDLASNELGTPSPVGTWHLAYHFQKLSGTWKVVEAVQLQYD